MYYAYVLESSSRRRTYLGITNNLKRRIRQHNGELVGGARQTRMDRPWRIALLIGPFQIQRDALRFEKQGHLMNSRKRYRRKYKLRRLRKEGALMYRIRQLHTIVQRKHRMPPYAIQFIMDPAEIENIRQNLHCVIV